MKGASLIVFALFIDGIQAALTASFVVIGAFPGTIGGGIAGCLAGNFVAGQIGCTILGFVGGLFGTLLDAAAIVTEPIGLVLSFVVSFCIAVTFGALLIGLLIFFRMFNWKYVGAGGIIELMPGFSILPSWTAMTVACVLQKNKDDKLAAQKIAAGLNATMNENLRENSYIQRGGREVLTPYRTPSVDGISAPTAQTNAA
jgi:hypothetical protein